MVMTNPVQAAAALAVARQEAENARSDLTRTVKELRRVMRQGRAARQEAEEWRMDFESERDEADSIAAGYDDMKARAEAAEAALADLERKP